MWPKKYRDYPKDSPLKKQEVDPGNGIIGCEMHDLNGWGERYHEEKEKKMSHTWDISIFYHRCPKCGKIFESRGDFTYRMGKYIKDLSCPNCHNAYTHTKETPSSFAPMIGNPQPVEWDWPS